MNKIMTDLVFAQFEDENHKHFAMIAEGTGLLFPASQMKQGTAFPWTRCRLPRRLSGGARLMPTD
jgi:hypothetical protein